MRDTLKAWVQDPDDWRIRYDYRPSKPRKPSIINRIAKWLKNFINTPIGFFLFVIFLSSLGAALAGMS